MTDKPTRPDPTTITRDADDNGTTIHFEFTVSPDHPGRIDVTAEWNGETWTGYSHELSDHHHAVMYRGNPEINGQPTRGSKLPDEKFEELKAAFEACKQYPRDLYEWEDAQAAFEYEVVLHRYNVGPDWPTAALVFKPTSTPDADEATRHAALLDANDLTDDYLAVPRDSGLAEGDVLTPAAVEALDAITAPDLDAFAEQQAAAAADRDRVEREQAAREAARAARKDALTMTVTKQWQSGRGEGHALHARVTLTDPETGETGEFSLRNAVDIGFQVSAETDVSDDFEARGVAYLREFGPLPTGIRMSEDDTGGVA